MQKVQSERLLSLIRPSMIVSVAGGNDGQLNWGDAHGI
jgi:hypothetical protein